jgi:beta-galactosidase
VPYQPGRLRAVGYEDGREVAADEVRTAGPAAKIRLTVDRAGIADDGSDLAFVTVRIEDQQGNLCPQADNLVHFDLTGPATIAGVDNGNPATTESFQADHRKAFSGMALLIVRSRRGEPGMVQVRASSHGLQDATTSIKSEEPSLR